MTLTRVALQLLGGAACVLLIPESAAAQASVARREARVDSLVEAARRTLGAPGVTIAVASRGRIAYARGYGMTDVENAVPATVASEYRTASVAKPFTAVAVLRLVRSGKLSLGKSIRTYVPELPAQYDKVTLLDLLRHTSGVRHYRDEGEFVTMRHCDSLQQALAIFASDPLEHAPGEKITYSSYGYVLLGLAVERASGVRYDDFMQAAVFEPASMHATRIDDLDIIPHRARGYTRTAKRTLRNAAPVDVSCRRPAGGFVSTAGDLVRFAIALDTGALLDTASVHEMMQSHITPVMIANTLAGLKVPPGFEPPGMGFGWAVEPDGHAVYHGGNQPGFTSMLYHVPAQHVSVAVMMNIEGAGDEITALAREIASMYAVEAPATRQ